MEESLDNDISSLRSESPSLLFLLSTRPTDQQQVTTLQKHRHLLRTSLLSSTPIQSLLSQSESESQPQFQPQSEISPLLSTAASHTRTNHHRIAFTTTTFPFTDPDPTTTSPNLLGIRIDISARDGKYVHPYYIFVKKSGEKEKAVGIHRHTIPGFVGVDKLARAYLGDYSDGGGEEALKPWKKGRRRGRKGQDLKGLVREVRRELVSWHLRRDVVELLNERLRLRLREREGGGGEGIESLNATAVDARYFRLLWTDGRVALFKVSNSGKVDRAVVIGETGRRKDLERALTGGDGRVESVLDRLG